MLFGHQREPNYSALATTRYRWRPGLRQLPYAGLGALLLSLTGIVASIMVLLVSNGDPIRNWRFQPTVYLSIASTVTNISLAMALFEGASVTWWTTAMKDGTNVGDLHRIWAFGNNFTDAALRSHRHFNRVALASLLVAISPINGPLLQRASTIGQAEINSTRPLQVRVAKLVPQGFSGIVSSRGDDVNMLTTNFSSIARDCYSRSKISISSACEGTCSTKVLGAGFHVNCSSYEAPYNVDHRRLGESDRFWRHSQLPSKPGPRHRGIECPV